MAISRIGSSGLLLQGSNSNNGNLKTQKQLVNNQRWLAVKFKTADCLSVLVSIKKKEALLYILVKSINSSHKVLFF